MAETKTAEQALTECCSIVELRQYTLKPGRRDELITLFEEHFIEGRNNTVCV
ncbi:NIPSNAP family protein [Ktedonospora formicarum]|uniref:Uncharacterized protein n=1 Tax=Ktedonospora formicarum TaxID=2778364 RepID=A0A8J3I8G7_9CHLR|nr:NIPSNAP family protein [Ktedonospora formicarum]GHO47962.1 hypothetical protein KSX_61250 [Ktedonospora formicarum]